MNDIFQAFLAGQDRDQARRELALQQQQVGQGNRRLDLEQAAQAQAAKQFASDQAFRKQQADQSAQWNAIMGVGRGDLEQVHPNAAVPASPLGAAAALGSVGDATNFGGVLVKPVSPEVQADRASIQKEKELDRHRQNTMSAVGNYLNTPIGKELSPEDRQYLTTFSQFGVQLPNAQDKMDRLKAQAFQSLVRGTPDEKKAASTMLQHMYKYEFGIHSAAGLAMAPYRQLPYDIKQQSSQLGARAYKAFQASHPGKEPTNQELLSTATGLVMSGNDPYGMSALQEMHQALGTAKPESFIDEQMRKVFANMNNTGK